MLYEKFFYLKENPFNITPDPRFLYLSKKHQEALEIISFGISERKGFLMLSGEVGTGKTTLCRALLDRLDTKVKSALIFNPLLSDIELIQAINQDFGLKVDSISLKEQLDVLNSFLVEKARDGGNAVVIIDEAQNLSLKALEMIRLLSNLETEKMKLLQILLVGQPELREKLKLPELRQLNQRIVVRYHLKSLNFEEAKAYIFNRLTIAGGRGNIRFTSTALKSIYEASSGIPRLINIVCDRALTAAFVAGKRVINDEIERRAVDELDMDGTFRKDIEIPHKKSGVRGLKPGIRYASYLAVSTVILAVIFAMWWDDQKPAIAPLAASTLIIKSIPTEPAVPPSPAATREVDKPSLQQKEVNEIVSVSNEQSILRDSQFPDNMNKAEPLSKDIAGDAVSLKGLIILVNGVKHTVSHGEALEVSKGDKFKIVDAIVEGAASKDLSVNLLGFVPKKSVNTGEDRGYLIDTAKSLWAKYSVKQQGAEYPIVVKYGDKRIGEVFIKIKSGYNSQKSER